MSWALSLALGAWKWMKLGGSAVRGFLSALNAQGWIGLIASCALLGLWIHTAGEARHWKKQSDRFEKLYNADEDSAKRIAQHAVQLKAQIEALQANISTKLKERHDAENARIRADADAVRLRGPGKAACPGNPGPPATPGGREQASSSSPDAGSQVPSGDWAAVPWDWLVTVIEEHDQLLNDVQTYRANDKAQGAQRLSTPPSRLGQNKPNG